MTEVEAQQYVGQYQTPGGVVSVVLEGDFLKQLVMKQGDKRMPLYVTDLEKNIEMGIMTRVIN